MSMRKILIFPIFAVLLVFFMFSNNAYASSSYEIGPGDPNQDCEKLGGSFVSGIRFECDVGTSFTLSTGDSITIDPKTRLAIIGGGTLDVNGGTITIKNGVVFGNLATFGGAININNGGIIDIFGSMVDFQGTIDNIGGTITNENGAIISANGDTITNEAGGTFINTSGSDINIQGGAVINMCGAFINNGQVNGGTIENQCSTATTLSSLPNPSTSGQSVTFTATVAPSSGTIPDGETITFYENGTSVGTSITSAGSASFATALANTGSYSIIAIYPGDNSFPSSTSNAVLQTVTNTPPVANPDSYAINENTELFVPALTGVLSNDKDSDGDVLIVSLTTGPTHGSMMLNSNGSLTYTPNSDFVGSDSFVYQADDGHGNTASSTDTIIVNQIVCPAGSFLSSGDNTCTPAPAGSYVSSTGSTSAALCPVGTFTDTSGNIACTPAPAGSYVPTTGSTSAALCPVGTFTDTAGQLACTSAPAGSFATGPGSTSAALCPVGTFTDTSGQSVCTPAPAGSYVPTTGSTSDMFCAPGSYQPNTSQTSCILADPGFFVSSSGATQQTQCPPNTTSEVPGSTMCRTLTPTELTNNLITIKEGMHLQQGITNSLDAKLNAVIDSLNSHQNNTAMNQLKAFINEVNAQTGKKITSSQTSQLITAAQNIINSIH